MALIFVVVVLHKSNHENEGINTIRLTWHHVKLMLMFICSSIQIKHFPISLKVKA